MTARARSRQVLFAAVVAVVVGVGLFGTAAVRADTQWWGPYYGKTYLNNWNYYEIGPITVGWCGGGIWGGTYYDYGSVTKYATLWSDAWTTDFWGFWGWQYQGSVFGTGHGYPAEVNMYNGACTRGATDHEVPVAGAWWTTSDGF